MRYQETWLLTIGTLGAALATSSSASTTGNNILEVVLVFPKNKTYKLQNGYPLSLPSRPAARPAPQH